MAEFTQTMSGDSRYSIKLTVTEVVPSDYVTTNKTNVNYTLTATKSGGSGYWNNNANNPVKVTINGTDVVNTNVAYDFRNATPKTITLASGTVTGIEHNADGSKTIAVSGYFKDNGNSLGQATASGNLTLTTIPRASIPTVDEAPWDYLGNTLTIRTNRASNSFTHTLKFKVGSTQIGSAVTGVGDTYSWTPTISTYAPYTTSGLYAYVTIECTTYNGSTQIGTPQATSMLMYVPANSTTAPDCSISIQEDNATMKTLNWGVYVKGKSQLKVSLTGTPKYYGSITDYSIAINNSTVKSGTNTATGTFTTTYTTNILTSSGSGSVTASVKDNRGSTTNATAQSYTVQDYSNPQIATAQVYRCDSSGNQDDSGTYIKYIYGGSISSVSNKNSKTFALRYRPKNGSWTTVSDSSWNSSYTCSKTATLSGFSTSTEYEFEFSATDSFTTTTITKEIGTEPDMMNFNSSGKSMAIGGVSQRTSSEKVLDVYTDLVTKEAYVGSIASKNMFNKNNVTPRYYYDNTGTLQLSDNWAYEIIEVKPNTNYYLSGNNYNNTVANIVLLNSSKTFINSVGGYKNVGLITTTNTTKYIGLSIAIYGGAGDLDTLQLEKGSTATSYTPYQELNPDNFKNEEIVVGSIRSKNMFSLNSRFVSYSDAKYDLLSDGIKVTNTSSSGNNNVVRFIVFDVTKFIGETLTLSAKAVSSASNPGCMYMRLCKSDGTTSDASYPAQLTSSTTNGNIKVSYTIPSGIGDYHYLMIAFYSSRNYTPTVNSYVNYTNIQLEKGSQVTNYMPYQNLDGMENYSMGETVIGTWINGKPLYRKVFDIGSLPNNSTKTVSTGLSNIIPRNLYGYGYNSNTKVMVALNNGNPVGLNLQIQAYYSDGNILIQTGTDRSSYSGYVTLEYTKTTD